MADRTIQTELRKDIDHYLERSEHLRKMRGQAAKEVDAGRLQALEEYLLALMRTWHWETMP